MKVKLIQAKTGLVREIEDTDETRFRILTRVGFVPAGDYVAPVAKTVKPKLTLAEVVERQQEQVDVVESEGSAEKAVHAKIELSKTVRISPSVRELIAEHGIDPSLIVGTGKNGAIKKVDVLKYLEDAGSED